MSARVPLAVVQGATFLVMGLSSVLVLAAVTPGNAALLVAGLLALLVYLVRLASAIRVRRWVRRQPIPPWASLLDARS